MNTKIEELMNSRVMTAQPHQTFGHVKKLMHDHSISCLPVVGPDKEPVGIVTASDLLDGHPDGSHISQFMSRNVYTVPVYGDPSLAARIMRNHHIHHVVVTHEQEVVGIISSFDLLQLVENHRFVMKDAPTKSKRKGKRQKSEAGGS